MDLLTKDGKIPLHCTKGTSSGCLNHNADDGNTQPDDLNSLHVSQGNSVVSEITWASSSTVAALAKEHKSFIESSIRRNRNVTCESLFLHFREIFQPGVSLQDFTETTLYKTFKSYYTRCRSQMRPSSDNSTQNMIDVVQAHSLLSLLMGGNYTASSHYNSPKDLAMAVINKLDAQHRPEYLKPWESHLKTEDDYTTMLLTIPFSERSDLVDPRNPSRLHESICYTSFTNLYNLLDFLRLPEISGNRVLYTDGTYKVIEDVATVVVFGGGDIDVRPHKQKRSITTSMRPFVHCFSRSEA